MGQNIDSTTLPLSANPQQQVHSSLQNAQRAAINNALMLLQPDVRQTMPNVEVVSGPPINHFTLAQRQKVTNAYTPIEDPETKRTLGSNMSSIYVKDNTPLYEGASNGYNEDLINLASTLMHERQHVEHGPDEGSAYDVQLAILKQLGAKPTTIKGVEAAKAAVTGSK